MEEPLQLAIQLRLSIDVKDEGEESAPCRVCGQPTTGRCHIGFEWTISGQSWESPVLADVETNLRMEMGEGSPCCPGDNCEQKTQQKIAAQLRMRSSSE